MSTLKRKRLPPAGGLPKALTGDEFSVYNVIRSKENMGITSIELKRELKTMKDKVFAQSLKSLKEKKKIKEVKNVQNKRTHLMAMEFEPSTELTGGVWFSEGHLDTAYIETLTKVCAKLIREQKVVTEDGLWGKVNASRAFTVEIPLSQIQEILKNLVLGGEVMRAKSTGLGDYASIPAGTDCYRSIRKAQHGGARSIGAMVSIPCGVCPRINECTPDGIISPITCVYYNKWLEF